MENRKVSQLLEKFKKGIAEGEDPYFDVNEIVDLLNEIEYEENSGKEEVYNPNDFYEDILNLGLRLHPHDQTLQIKKVGVECCNDNYTEALKLAAELTYTDDPEIHIARIICFCMTNQAIEAFELMNQLEDEENDFLEEIYEGIVLSLSMKEAYPECLIFAKRGVEIFPDNEELKESLLYVYHETGKKKESISILNEIININPYSYEHWIKLGILYAELDELEKALEAIDFAFSCPCTDNYMEAKKLKILYLLNTEELDKALTLGLEINEESPTLGNKMILLKCYVSLGEEEKAYNLSKSMMETHPEQDYAEVWSSHIMICAFAGKTEEAKEGILEYDKKYPNSPIRPVLQLISLKIDMETSSEKIEDDDIPITLSKNFINNKSNFN